jgi:hypothetical protein
MVHKTEDSPSNDAEHYVGRNSFYDNVAEWTEKSRVKNEFVNLSLKKHTNKQVKSFGDVPSCYTRTAIVTEH